MKEEAKEERKRIKNIQKQCAREGKGKKKKKSLERERKLVGYCKIVGLTLFQIFTKMSLNNVI